jgi:hypothetical protein
MIQDDMRGKRAASSRLRAAEWTLGESLDFSVLSTNETGLAAHGIVVVFVVAANLRLADPPFQRRHKAGSSSVILQFTSFSLFPFQLASSDRLTD